MRKKRKNPGNTLSRLRKDLSDMNHDWSTILTGSKSCKEMKFLKKMAKDIKMLSLDAHKAEKIIQWKERAQLINHLLTTPWGAPFVGETTLLDAAEKFNEKDYRNSALFHLSGQLSHYGHQYENQTFQVFEDLENELD